MLIKIGSSFGGGVDVLDAPKITFDGSWFSWYVEFYGGTPYWEAQLFSSGTLTVQGSYVADLCGIGGGAGARGGVYVHAGNAGSFAVQTEVPLSGTMAVTVGAGGGSGQNGGNTACGTLTAPGGQGFSGATAASAYRFHDPDKASEQGTAGAAYDSYSPGGGGWQHFRGVRNHGSGYGGGGCRVGEGKYADGFPGALVIRIPM